MTPNGGIDPVPPLFYVLKRGLSPEQADVAVELLSVTPCQAAVVRDFADTPIALSFAPQIFWANDEVAACEFARKWATETGRPLLVLGEAEFLDAVFPDGRREPLASVC